MSPCATHTHEFYRLIQNIDGENNIVQVLTTLSVLVTPVLTGGE